MLLISKYNSLVSLVTEAMAVAKVKSKNTTILQLLIKQCRIFQIHKTQAAAGKDEIN